MILYAHLSNDIIQSLIVTFFEMFRLFVVVTFAGKNIVYRFDIGLQGN